MINQPYTYLIKCIPTNQYYYGVQYGKNSHPDNLWVTYFTSSKIIKQLIITYGLESFVVKIRKTFTSKKQACEWESKFLKRVNAANSDKWINQHNSNGDFSNTVYNGGKPVTSKTRIKMAIARTGKKSTQETKDKLAVAQTTRMKSIERRVHLSNLYKDQAKSIEMCTKLSKTTTGKILSSDTCKKISEARRLIYGNKVTTSINVKFKQGKNYKIIQPDGTISIINNLNKYCKINNLDQSNMTSVAKGKLTHYKGYKCIYI